MSEKEAGIDVQVVFTGSDKGNRSYIEEQIREMGLEDNIVITGFLKDEEIKYLYTHAVAMIYASLMGPNNLPPVEATYLHCPVIITDLEGHKEQLGDSEKEPLFSVVIPAYNREKTVGRAIESVRRQTYQNYECIVVDDGSKDNTAGVVGRYLSCRRVTYIHQENGGAQKARDHGLHQATGECIIFLDSDDELLPKCLEKVVEKTIPTANWERLPA